MPQVSLQQQRGGRSVQSVSLQRVQSPTNPGPVHQHGPIHCGQHNLLRPASTKPLRQYAHCWHNWHHRKYHQHRFVLSWFLQLPFTICAFHSLSYMLVIFFNTYLLGNTNVLKTMLGPYTGFCQYKTSKVIFEHLSFSLQFKTKQNYRFRLSLKFLVKTTRPIFPCGKYQ